MASHTHSIQDLEGPEFIRQERRERLAMRCGWCVMLLALTAAGAGFLGPGSLSSRVKTNDDQSLRVEYFALEHYGAPTVLRCEVRAPSDDDGLVRLAVTRSFAEQAEIERILPAPVRSEAHGENLVYVFRAEAGPRRFAFHFRHRRMGRQVWQISPANKTGVRLAQYVLP
jgi:hypothetical protein